MEEQDMEDIDDDLWWDEWDRRRQLAVTQVVCFVAYAVYKYRACYEMDCKEYGESAEGKRRKVREWDGNLSGIKEGIDKIANAIREGNAIRERTQPRVYSEKVVYEELSKMRFDQNQLFEAYIFLTEDPARVRAFFGYHAKERRAYLLQMMRGSLGP